MLLLSRDGVCVRSVPDRSEFRGQAFGDRPWFAAARGGAPGPSFRVTDEPGLGRTLKIVQPLMREKRFAGALVGVIALAEDNLIAPALHENLPPDTDAVLVDETGQIIYPPDRARAAEGSGWAEAIAAATRGASGTLTAEANGQKALFAFSPVRAATPYAVVFAWPWRTLTANLEQQGLTLGGILLFGLILAAIAGVLLAGYLARPLQALASGAIRIARGEPVPAAERPPRARDRGDRRAARGVRGHGDVDPPARSGAARRGGAAGAARARSHAASCSRRRRRWSRPSASRRWARRRRRSRTS